MEELDWFAAAANGGTDPLGPGSCKEPWETTARPFERERKRGGGGMEVRNGGCVEDH